MAVVALIASTFALASAPARAWSVTRIAGDDRIATAVAVSRSAFGEGADAVLIARADTYPDALAAAPLATALAAPLLLTHSARLDPRVAAEIDRLGADRAVLLGQTGALSASVEDSVDDHVGTVRRIGGADRFETASRIAAALRDAHVSASGAAAVDSAFVARATDGRGWPDALTGATLAARRRVPLLLADRDRLPHLPWRALADATLVGGPAVLSDALADDLRRGAAAVTRIAGDDRYTTGLAVADHLLTLLDDTGDGDIDVWLATGENFPDALAAGPAVAARRAVLLLAPPRWEGSSVQRWIRLHADRIATVTVLGGKRAVSRDVSDDLADLGSGNRRYQLMYATHADLEDLRPLEGATVSGRIYVVLAACRPDGSACSVDLSSPPE